MSNISYFGNYFGAAGAAAAAVLAGVPDLITQPYLAGFLADLNLTPAQLAKLPDFTSAASQAVRKYCNRRFTLATYDELYTVEPPATRVTLRQFPVVSVDRCATNPSAIVSVWNTDPYATRAVAALATTGDAASGLVVTGLLLSRWTSGQRIDTPITFTANMTAAALAAAAIAAGGSWQALAANGYELWPVADLRPPQGPLPCRNTSSADFLAHADDVEAYPDDRLGYLNLGTPDSSAADSPRWGPTWSGAINDIQSYGGRNGLRVVYTAGWIVAPADVQQYTAEAVKAAVQRVAIDSALKSESDGVLSWSARDQLFPLPNEVMVGLSPWINRRA